MSTADLIILGYLKKMPMSAYEFTKFAESIHLQKWVKIGSPTIYQNIKKLAAKNYLSGRTVKEGEMPEKVIYRLTESGEEYFLELMNRFSADPGNVYFDFNAFIVNLSLVDKDSALNMLGSLRHHFSAGMDIVDTDTDKLRDIPFEGKSILKLYRVIFRDVIEWIDDLIKHYQ